MWERSHRGSRAAAQAHRAALVVNVCACTGHGLCAQLLANVTLDEWGYPVVHDDAAGADEAATAIRLCPARALYRS